MNPPWAALDATGALQQVVWVYAVAVGLATVEYLSVIEEFGDRGAFSWKVFRASGSYRANEHWFNRTQALVFGRTGTSWLLWLQVAAVPVLAFAPSRSVVQWSALVVSTLVLLLLTARQRYGQDGADQMTLIVGIVCVLTFGPLSSDLAMQLGLWFIALQATLAYLSAGAAKLLSPVWRRGLAVGLVVDTASYGSRAVSVLLRRWPWVGKTATWGTIAFEMAFVLALVGPWCVTGSVLAAGILFHVGIAAVMGLNNFVPAFISTYPAVLWTSQVL